MTATAVNASWYVAVAVGATSSRGSVSGGGRFAPGPRPWAGGSFYARSSRSGRRSSGHQGDNGVRSAAKHFVSLVGLEPFARRLLNRPKPLQVARPSEALTAIQSFVRGAAIDVEAASCLAPVLARYGEPETADWLIRLVAKSVLFPGPAGLDHVGTTQKALMIAALHGGVGSVPEAREALTILVRQIGDDMRSRAPGGRRQHGELAALGALALANAFLDAECSAMVARRRETVVRALGERSSLAFASLIPADIRALVDLGHRDLATRALIARRFVSTPDLPEVAWCAYKAGEWTRADRWLARFETSAQRSFERPESAGYYLRANLCRVNRFFDSIADELPSQVSASDGRARAVLARVRPGNRVLEVGCGKARFLDVVRRVVEDVDCTGIDLSPTLLKRAPKAINTAAGTLESVPCRSDHFDVVFSVEAIEHSANWPAAVRELARVTRPGGWLIIIDKPGSAWGWLPCPPWERWPTTEELSAILREACDDVEAAPVAYDEFPADGRIMVWRGRKKVRWSRSSSTSCSGTCLAPG